MINNPIDLETLILAEAGMCVMEAVAYVAGEKFSDHPGCASTVIGEFLRSWNDGMNDADRQMLKPYITRLVGSKGTAAVESARSWMALDWQCRVSTPAWLRLIKLEDVAKALEDCAPIVNAQSAKAAQTELDTAKKLAYAAWAAAGYAAGDAARAAAWAAAGYAARAAAGAAARDAAGDAARDAAGSAARPTVEHLQGKALKLLDAMLSLTEKS